ncbi:MAG: histidine kinase dimerization/phospho-acceptor domain-containing protein [Patescibacteria group bacterium]
MDKQGQQPTEAQKNLISTVSHKLKGPLTTINLYTEALLSGSVGNLSDEQRQYVQEVHDASKKMVVYVKDLKNIFN